jgi:hypothetical protein
MTYRFVADSKGSMSSRRVVAMETKPTLDLDALERQIRMEKQIQNPKTKVHLCTLQELIDAARLGLGVQRKPDLRRTIGDTGDDQ